MREGGGTILENRLGRVGLCHCIEGSSEVVRTYDAFGPSSVCREDEI